LLKYKFDNFIEYYDFEECEKIMEEDDELMYEKNRGSTGSDNSEIYGDHNLGKSVTDSLNALSLMMQENGGSLSAAV